MNPIFRSDLTCSREEQQGVVFYRIDDPTSQTSFRLYEIEYLIAKKLDGARDLAGVIAAVKTDFNFDISEPDLQRFVSQLDSMGFLQKNGAGSAAGGGETQLPTDKSQRQRRRTAETVELLGPAAASNELNDADKDEWTRLVRAGFVHVKQGYLAHARDYFLAAKELTPSHEHLSRVINQLDIIGDLSGPAEVEYLWKQMSILFPEMASEVGPLLESKVGIPTVDLLASPEESAPPRKSEDVRHRALWLVVLLAVVLLGIGGLAWVVKTYNVFGGAVPVVVNKLKAETVPIYFGTTAQRVAPARERWLSLASDGEVEVVNIPASGKVEAGDLLVQLRLTGSVAKQYQTAKQELEQAKSLHQKALTKMQAFVSEREAINRERAAAEENLRNLRPKNVLGGSDVSKQDVDKWKSTKVEANKSLSRLAKKERLPRKIELKAKQALEAATRKLALIEQTLASKLLRAPFAGVVSEVKIKPGMRVTAATQVMLLRDFSEIELNFTLPQVSKLQSGGEAQVSIRQGPPVKARVLSAKPEAQGSAVVVRLLDPSGSAWALPAKDFSLLKEFAEPAFRIPVQAVVESAGSRLTKVIVVTQNRAIFREVDVLQNDSQSAVVQDVGGTLRDGMELVVGRLDKGQLAEIRDGADLEF